MKYLLILLVAFGQQAAGQKITWTNIPPQTDASFRGLSVVDDSVAWVSGSKGYIGKSINGGRDWTFQKVKSFETLDFRSIYAFDNLNAVIANAGSPAYVLCTTDGGRTWKEVYRNNDSAAFIDGVDFWNDREGLIYGDPINSKMLVLTTADGGNTWQALTDENRPQLKQGEASFAASGTAIRCIGEKAVVILTGGTVSRAWISDSKGQKWEVYPTPLIQGSASTGAFSIDFAASSGNAIIVGGDYKQDTLRKDHVFYTVNGGDALAPIVPTRGYRECVAYVTDSAAIATGPSGTDISYDCGVHWEPLSDENGLHVVRKSRKGNLVIFAGSNGKIVLSSVPRRTH